MPVITNAFNGKLNYDVAPYRIANGDYIDSLNITIDSQGVGKDKVIANIVGNTQKSYTLPAGTNKVIGGYADKLRNRYYFFVWNNNGYNLILYYDYNADTVNTLLASRTDSDDVDILNFNPSYKIFGVNIFYRDEGDIIFFNDGYNPPRNISTGDNYNPWLSEYLEVAKAPFQMPPKVTYENDDDVSVNNLRNSLFQFRVRPVYDNNQKSVWGTPSIVPLPFQPSLLLTEDTFTNNSRISVSFSSGGADVKKIELAVRQFSGSGVTSDWMLVKTFNKDDLSINDDELYTFKFYNDGLYTTIDILDVTQLQDYVPQLANAQELLNGNVPIYGGITEGYDKTDVIVQASVLSDTDGFFYDYNGVLFVAVCNGVDSGSYGTTMKVYVYGTGTNTSGIITTLNNAKCTFKINVVDNSGNDIGASYISSSDSLSVSTLLNSLDTSLQSKGWNPGTITDNVLTITFTDGFVLYSSGIIYDDTSAQIDTTQFAYPFEAGMEIGIQYYDRVGRTNGVQTYIGSTFQTNADIYNQLFPCVNISIYNRPPEWASYYSLERINNSTYQKRLEWISQSAYSSGLVEPPGVRFAYIGLSNIEKYNEEISSTDNVVSYEFQAGDRIRMFARYDVTGTKTALTNTVDYEVVGTEVNPKIDGIIKDGTFIKIYYPSNDIDSNLKFDGTDDFLHYQILLYSIKKHLSDTETTFFDFGKTFGIGNAGTDRAYHIGLEQTQTPDLIQPAKITINNGDLFYRGRTVPFGTTYTFTAGGNDQDIGQLCPVVVSPEISNTSYEIHDVDDNHSISSSGYTNPAVYPTYSDTADSLFYNKLSSVSQSRLIRLKAEIPVYNNSNHNTTWNVGVIICTSLIPFAAKTNTVLSSPNPISVQSGTVKTISIDNIVSVPPTGKVFFYINSDGPDATQENIVQLFELTIEVIESATIEIIEQSFNDTYNIITNDNGRPSVIDINARRAYYPTTVRFGQAYQENTNINGTNRFYADNFDDYDRSFGDIMRLHVRDRYMKVYQKLKVGNVPILTQIVKDATGNVLEANSDKIINKIQYYSGDYGIGDVPSSLAWDNFADYFVDDYRGVVCRLSQDGITPLSIIYETNAFFVQYLPQFRKTLNNGNPAPGQPYTGDPTVYGTFDAYTNKYIVALEEINRYDGGGTLIFHQDSFTLSFDEINNRFESPLSYKPEWLGCLNTLLVSLKNGLLYTHNSDTYCNFYGVQYEASITTVFNTAALDKKTWISIMGTSNVLWDCPEIQTQLNTYGSTPQESYLLPANFTLLEGEYSASFLRGVNSPGGWINGSALKGGYIIIKFRVQNASQFVFLNTASVKYIDSALNVR